MEKYIAQQGTYGKTYQYKDYFSKPGSLKGQKKYTGY